MSKRIARRVIASRFLVVQWTEAYSPRMTQSNSASSNLLDRRPDADLYERDFYRWTVEQAHAVRDGRWDDIDWENLAEEIDSVGRNDKRSVRSHLSVLLAHLLKCVVQPDRWTMSWDYTIRTQRREISLLLDRNPSLRGLPAQNFGKAYADAIFLAHRDTGLGEEPFPESPPFTLEEALSPDFFPGPPRRRSR